MSQDPPSSTWQALNVEIAACDRCPRLRAHCRTMASQKRRAFLDWEYWGRPVPNFGDPQARLLIVGLAPAAHGANRTGRMFTGDRSGDWLYRALHKAGFANQPHSTDRGDALVLSDCAITAICHCAPPENKPSREEIAACQTWLNQTAAALPVREFVALGQIAWKGTLDKARRENWHRGKAPKFGHAQTVRFDNGQWLVGSYHPSQQNTFTRKLTEAMLDRVFEIARGLLESGDGSHHHGKPVRKGP